jgi:hypothetical protein
MENVDAAPTPESAIVCGLPAALSVMVIDPNKLPEALGVKVTLIVQELPAATLVPQLLICAKFPDCVTLEITSGALPILDKVTGCAALVLPIAWLVNVSVLVESVTTGTVRPLPESCTVCVLPGTFAALSVIVSVPERIPVAVGVNFTLIEQVPLTARIAPQVVVSAKSTLATMLAMFSGALP